jgi:hypothetical protein
MLYVHVDLRAWCFMVSATSDVGVYSRLGFRLSGVRGTNIRLAVKHVSPLESHNVQPLCLPPGPDVYNHHLYRLNAVDDAPRDQYIPIRAPPAPLFSKLTSFSPDNVVSWSPRYYWTQGCHFLVLERHQTPTVRADVEAVIVYRAVGNTSAAIGSGVDTRTCHSEFASPDLNRSR